MGLRDLKVVEAVLAVTPIDPESGLVIVKYALAHCGSSSDMEQFAIHGDPEPIAARQAVAVLRWLARDLSQPLCATDANRVDELADRIRAQ